MIDELDKLIKRNEYSDEELATALQKNWKVARITLEEAKYLDAKLGAGLKNKMPDGWDFMVGRPEERLEVAGIKLLPKQA
jgi:identified by metaGeneAnnotator